MDFIDDPPEISEQERFQRHNRFLRSLKSDTLLIIDSIKIPLSDFIYDQK